MCKVKEHQSYKVCSDPGIKRTRELWNVIQPSCQILCHPVGFITLNIGVNARNCMFYRNKFRNLRQNTFITMHAPALLGWFQSMYSSMGNTYRNMLKLFSNYMISKSFRIDGTNAPMTKRLKYWLTCRIIQLIKSDTADI